MGNFWKENGKCIKDLAKAILMMVVCTVIIDFIILSIISVWELNTKTEQLEERVEQIRYEMDSVNQDLLNMF